MKRTLQILVIVLIFVAPCLAGITYTVVIKSEPGLPDIGITQTSTLHGWASGQRGKVQFIGARNPMMASGSYLITHDGAKSFYVVDPGRKTYMKLDMDAMLNATGNLVRTMRGQDVQFEAPKVEKLLDEDGGLVAGLPTRHFRYRTTYTVVPPLLGTRIITTVVEDIWATTKVADPAMGFWLKKQAPRTGDEQFDAIVATEMNKVPGFPLKRVSTTTVENNGEKRTSHDRMEVVRLKFGPVPASMFRIPASYKQEQPRMDDGTADDDHDHEE